MAGLPLTAPPAAPRQIDDWPRTTRVLPWLLALFMGMVFLVPFDSAQITLSLPFDAKFDRIAVVLIAVVWIAAAVAGGRAAPVHRRSPVNIALTLFTGIAIASVLLNLEPLANAGELGLALKKLILLCILCVFFYIVASAVRPGEVRSFGMLLVGLAVVTAAGTIYEYRSGTNLFFDVADAVLPGGVVDTRSDSIGFDATGRRGITGPTSHGLAVTTMLALALPLAVLAAMRARELKERLFFMAITAIIISGSTSTVRKSAAIVPLVALLIVAVYRPRAMLRLAPMFLVLLVLVHFMAPGAMGSIKNQLFPKGGLNNTPSVQGRKSDYPAVKPDLQSKPIIGRGYGTYEPDTYRLLDNQYLGLKISTGWLGYSAYVLMLLSIALIGHQAARRRDPSRSPPAIAAIAAAGAVAMASQLFDVLAFPQVFYVLLFLAGLATAAAHPRPATEPSLATIDPRLPTRDPLVPVATR